MRVWRNAEDTCREFPVAREDGTWTYASWRRYPQPVGGWFESITSMSPYAKSESAIVEHICRSLGSRGPLPEGVYIGYGVWVDPEAIEVSHPTEGWPEAEQWQAPEGSTEIEPGQVWYRASRSAVVECHAPMHPTGALGVLVRFRESNGTSGRLAAAAWYGEERFRKLYRESPATPRVSTDIHDRDGGRPGRRRRRT